VAGLPYCGFAPVPGTLLGRFNFDPALIATLILFCAWQVWAVRGTIDRRPRQILALAGWLIAAGAFLSPLCALSVALFSARVVQHVILMLVAAPLIAMVWPQTQRERNPGSLWRAVLLFFLALWCWHLPIPYEETLRSVGTYWAMQLSLFGSAIWLWRELLQHPAERIGPVLTASMVTFLHIGLLGAMLSLAGRPLFHWHMFTTQPWGLSPRQDQQVGGSIMWIPGIALFLWSALRSLSRLRGVFERAHPA
jgi:putative membrane protein